ncbi:hypothetical protein B0J14DRAFT_563896 [Halenospora varia]|nr:hypothetical protein B0J14DRAFT_563896 [Halenospora varia]
MCGVCGKKVNDAATLRKHVKTHIDVAKGESITPSKRKGGPMSNLEKRRFENDQSPTRRSPKLNDPAREVALDDENESDQEVLRRVRSRVEMAIQIKNGQAEEPLIKSTNAVENSIIIDDEE